jgi:DNA (cytosine-5)-methyltransferase 1
MKPLTYASVCSGIECASVAVRGLPLKPVFFSEIEPYPCAVLKYHYPQVPNLGDMTKITYNKETNELTNGRTTLSLPDGGLDILFGGTPCQDFSLAGLRKGAGGDDGELGNGTRSSLCFHYVRLLREIQPRWFVYENVAGMLSANQGRDFAHFLLALGQSGYGSISYRVLDAQYTRVDGYERALPQRRRRVWVVGHLGAVDKSSAEVLLEPYGMYGDSVPRRKTREELAASIGHGAEVHGQVVGVKSTNSNGGDVMPTLTACEAKGQQNQKDNSDGYVISRKHDLPVGRDGGGMAMTEELDADIASMEHIIRRLTPLECERLQGLPDGYTVVHFTDEMLTEELVDEFIAIKLNWDTITAKANTAVKPKSRNSMRSWLKGISEEPPDSPRFKACGNGWACNQPRWIVMNLLNTQYPGWDDVPCGTSSHGINPQNGSTMFPCSAEVSQTLAVGHGGGGCFRVGSDKSNSMLSNNPNSGFPMIDVSPTLDCTVPTPSKNQGGLVIVHKKGKGV